MAPSTAQRDISQTITSLSASLVRDDGDDTATSTGKPLRLLADLLAEVRREDLRSSNTGVAEPLLQLMTTVMARGQGAILAEHLTPATCRVFCELLCDACEATTDADSNRALLHEMLDAVRYPAFLERIAGDLAWEKLILRMIRASSFTPRAMFDQRARDYSSKVLFTVLQADTVSSHAWQDVAAEVRVYRRALAALLETLGKPGGMVAFLTDNSLEMAYLDLACLTGGIVNIMIPLSSQEDHIRYILGETEAAVILVADDTQLARVASCNSAEAPHLGRIVMVHGSSSAKDVISLAELRQLGEEAENDRSPSDDVTALATIMYTSGTTGMPKGITFSQLNIVYKRFCRALALPQIGDQDRFLAYLPLFHTFGRWLEMMGSIFWGAEYVFLDNPAIDTIVGAMQRMRPTIFISIPKKWQQLYEHVATRVDLELDDDHVIRAAVEQATGGQLRWGLSAAGYLSPDVFTFFARNGTELMSGFGMTEATGGITMTPPGRYHENSLGKPLPGIEIRLADDGELLVRGAYVTSGYFGSDAQDDSFTADGWLHTGDIMQMDDHGFIEIIDRKKQIYKSAQGQTIAPQRIENFFVDVQSIAQVFLVGDHRPFNTLLIYPDWKHEGGALQTMSATERQAHFASLIVAVNKFLTPFERIVDFRIIDRPIGAEENELTPKGTYKRRTIEQNFDELIAAMYIQDYTEAVVDEIGIRIPNWFLRENGCLSGDVVATADGLTIPKLGKRLKIERRTPDTVRVGDFIYSHRGTRLDLQDVLNNAVHWIGNFDLVHFCGPAIFDWHRGDPEKPVLPFVEPAQARALDDVERDRLTELTEARSSSLHGLHLAGRHLQAAAEEDQRRGVKYIELALALEEGGRIEALAIELLMRPNLVDRAEIRRHLIAIGSRRISPARFGTMLGAYLDQDPTTLTPVLIESLAESVRTDGHLDSIEGLLDTLAADTDAASAALESTFDLLVAFGGQRPTRYARIRQLIVEYQLNTTSSTVRTCAQNARRQLLAGFRHWLGDNKKVAVDVETGEEYHWPDVITFEEEIEPSDRDRILRAIEDTCVLREAVFLFSGGRIIGLHNLPRGGVWASHLGTRHGKSVYRITIQTRYHGSYDIALNLNQDREPASVQAEINWLIVAGEARGGGSLVEHFGGYWPDLDLWSEEYVSGETIGRFIQRSSRRKNERDLRRLHHLWPYFVWSAAEIYFEFLRRTGDKIELTDPSPKNIVVPPHDYQTGGRLVSISNSTPFVSLGCFFRRFYDNFIVAPQQEYPFLHRDTIWRYVFSGFVEAEGEQRGLDQLRQLRDGELGSECLADLADFTERVTTYIEQVAEQGFMPKRFFFGVERFHRWLELNRDAAVSAQAQTLREIYESYGLYEGERKYPGSRTRFFLETVFVDSSDELKNALGRVVTQRRDGSITSEAARAMFSSIRESIELSEPEAFFLARIGYRHLRPTDSAELVRTVAGGTVKADLVVRFEDHDGRAFSVRSPVNPKEISRLHRLFLHESLQVDFRPEHRFLIAVTERGHLIGGLFFERRDEQAVYMDKVVVSGHFRRKGVGESLLKEFFSRLRNEDVRYVTTGFFRPEFFYRLGFKIARRYAGLVKDLGERRDGPPPDEPETSSLGD